ncbi:MAG: methanethiol S-methyltransferase [Planctomycetota bacterium]
MSVDRAERPSAFSLARTAAETPLVARLAAFLYAALTYVLFLGVFVYAIGFVGNFVVPKSIDSVATDPLGLALAVNLALLGVFAVQHSVMARPTFKRWWTRFVPEPVERATYSLFSSLALILLFWQWRPMGGLVWNIESEVLRGSMHVIYAAGWLVVLVSTFLLNHFDLFGLRQAWLFLRGREYTHLSFAKPVFYRHVRHPLYLGWILVFWAAPTMSVGHLVFAAATTAYILIAIQLEERNLVEHLGPDYAEYKRTTPMLLPLPGKRAQRAS